MADYAIHECAGCGILLPRNQLVVWKTRKRVGEVEHRRNTYDTKSFDRPMSDIYQNRADYLCLRCVKPKRRGRFFATVFWTVMILIGLLVIIGLI